MREKSNIKIRNLFHKIFFQNDGEKKNRKLFSNFFRFFLIIHYNLNIFFSFQNCFQKAFNWKQMLKVNPKKALNLITVFPLFFSSSHFQNFQKRAQYNYSSELIILESKYFIGVSEQIFSIFEKYSFLKKKI